MKLVGLGVPPTTVVRDDVDVVTEMGYFTPKLTDQFLGCCVNFTNTAIQVQNPSDIGSVEAAIARAAPKGGPATFAAAAIDSVAKAERAIKPQSIALGVFGGIAGLATLLIVGQLIGRQLRLRAAELDVLRALGAGPVMTAADGLIGILGALTLGALVAVVVAILLSPLAPLGPVRPVYPTPGLAFDSTVLGVGFAALVVSLGAVALALSYRNDPQRLARSERFTSGRPSAASRVTTALALPAPATTGVRFALEPGHGRATAPVRSAIFGAALASIVVIATVTFGASLDHLVSTPALYGWNWSYALSGGAGGGGGDIPARQATALLQHDRYLSAWSGADFAELEIDGQPVPTLGMNSGARVQPPILVGHNLESSGEIVLGALTLDQLHKHLGDMVTVSSGTGPPHRLQIVGLATMPTMGNSGDEHLEMGSGALLASTLIPAALQNLFNDPEAGPNAYFVDVRSGVNPVAARRSLERMTTPLSNNFNFGEVLQSVLRPAEIVNYRSMGTMPAILGGLLGAAAVVALGLTLLASVRRRRRELALLKAFGFTRSQLLATVAWQSNVAVAIGTIVGIPLGVVVGRTLWDTFAHVINAVPATSVPALTIVLVVAGALVLANLVDAVPGRIATRTPTALLLRGE